MYILALESPPGMGLQYEKKKSLFTNPKTFFFILSLSDTIRLPTGKMNFRWENKKTLKFPQQSRKEEKISSGITGREEEALTVALRFLCVSLTLRRT